MRRGWADDLRKAREKQSKKPKEEEEEDCVILDGDPNKPLEVKNELENEIDELVVVAEKGQIACRDYPHARHLCVTFPFNTNPHEKYCDLCHCYVCDTLAPCVYWVWGTDKSSDDHCHATDKEEMWRELRQRSKEEKLAQLQVSGLLETTLSNEPLCHQAVNCSQPLNVNEETQLQVSGLLETTLSNEPLRHQALNCSQPLNVNEERVVQLDLMSLALDRSTVHGDRLTGIVKWFDSQKGYGFISPEDGGADLFVHHSSIKSKGQKNLAEGERVEFEIEIDGNGRRKATNVSGPGGSLVQGTSGRDNSCIDFSMRGGRGHGDRIYGGRASASRRGYGRNKDAGASSLGGSIFQGITRKDNYGNSDSDCDSDSDASRCYKCGEMGHLARNCNGIGAGISNSDSGASRCYKCGEMGHLARNCNGIGGGIGNSDSDASRCYKCREMGHLARNCNGIGGSTSNNFRVRFDRGGGRKDYGSRASVSYRGGDSGRNRTAGVSSPGGSFLQEATSSTRDSDTPKCYNCGEIGHLTRNCDGGSGGRGNGLNDSDHRVRVDRGGGRTSAYRLGDVGRNKAVGVSSVDRFDNLLRETEIFPCFKCGELGHSSRDCDVVGVSNGFNRGYTIGSYNSSDNRQRGRCDGSTNSGRGDNSSDNRQRGRCDGSTNSGRGGSFELSNSRYNERNRAVSMRRPSGNLPRGNTRGGNRYGEIGNSTRDRPSMERGSVGCYICGKLGHQARDCYKERGGGRSEDGVSSCTCGEAGHLPDCPKKQDGGSGAEVPCFTCHEPGHLPIDCPKKHQIWRELHFGF